MSIILRPYQQELITEARTALKTHNSVLIQSATGTGKSIIASFMMKNAAEKGLLSFFIVHRVELIDQTSITFSKMGIEHGIIAAGYKEDSKQLVQICSIDTLRARLDKVKYQPNFIINDEAHHIGAASWSKVKDSFGDIKCIGLSASPQRTDGKGLFPHYTYMVKGRQIKWHIENGNLCDYEYYAPDIPDVSQVKTEMGDYRSADITEIMSKPSITGNMIQTYKEFGKDKKGIGFFRSIKNSEQTAEAFRNAGIIAVHLDSNTPKEDRKQIIADYRADKIRLLFNVGLFTEGFDVPDAKYLLNADPTKSLIKYMQSNGRVFRPAGDEKAIISDHAGNVFRHNLPCANREWSLEGINETKKNTIKPISLRHCKECRATYVAALVECPRCGSKHQTMQKEILRKIGDLKQLKKEELEEKIKLKKDLRREQGLCKSKNDLIAFAIRNNYKNPYGWANIVWNMRKK